MNESERLARELEKALQGGAWHGESWKEILSGVDRETALRRPIPGAHTIAEVVAHATVWHDVVRRRLGGESAAVSDTQDWAPAVHLSDHAWARATERLLETGAGLVDAVRRFPPERLHEPRPGIKGTWYELLSGELQHVLYHAGQVGLLRKAVSAPART